METKALTTIEGGGRVCNSKNWRPTVDVASLKQVETVPLGTRHVPVNHGDALDLFKNILAENNLPVLNENGMLSQNSLKYVYTADVTDASMEDLVFTIGFVNFNDKHKSFTGLAGERVFVCSNEMFSSQIREARNRHTMSIISSLRGKMLNLVEYFKRFRDARIHEIEALKVTPWSDQYLAQIVLSFHRNNIIENNSIIDKIVTEYDNPRHEEFKPRTAWSFQNACTEILKQVEDPCRRFNANIRIKKEMDTMLKGVIDIKAVDMGTIPGVIINQGSLSA